MRKAAVVVMLATLVVFWLISQFTNSNYAGSYERFLEEAPADLAETLTDIARRTITLGGES